MISIGNGKVPKCVTSFDSSAMIISFLEEEATIFSRSNAPPPPFISCKFESISSAPSIVRSRLCTSFNEIRGYLVAVLMLQFPLMLVQLEMIILLLHAHLILYCPIYSRTCTKPNFHAIVYKVSSIFASELF